MRMTKPFVEFVFQRMYGKYYVSSFSIGTLILLVIKLGLIHIWNQPVARCHTLCQQCFPA